MLFYPQGYQKPARLQGAFVSDEEVSAIVQFLADKNPAVEYNKQIEQQMNTGGASGIAAGRRGRAGRLFRGSRQIYKLTKKKLLLECCSGCSRLASTALRALWTSFAMPVSWDGRKGAESPEKSS